MNINEGNKLAQKTLAPVEKHIRANPGSMVRLAEFLSKKLGKRIARQRVVRWFAGDVESRPEPLFSSGLLMLEWLKQERRGR